VFRRDRRQRDAPAPSFGGYGREMCTRQKLLKYKEITPSAQQTVDIEQWSRASGSRI
jgi:hypothetical protein